MNIFATHLNQHLKVWFCWAAHPMVASQNALIQPWMGQFLYTFPPIPILQRTVIKIIEDQAGEVVLIELIK